MAKEDPAGTPGITRADRVDVPASRTRREVVRAGALGALLLPAASLVDAAGSAQVSAAPRAALDLDDPAQHLRAYVRMRGSSDGSLVAEVTQGFVYALLPKGRPRLVFQSRGFQLSRYRFAGDGAWVCRSRYFGTLADPLSGVPIEHWDNPFTGRRDDVKPTLYGPMDYVLTARRTLANPSAEQRAKALAEPGVRRWTQIGDLVTIDDELGPADDAGSQPPDFDIVSISARRGDLANESLASVPSQTSFGAVEPWREWMRMATVPGMLLWHLQSTKVASVDAVPPELRRIAEAKRPGLIQQAIDDKG